MIIVLLAASAGHGKPSGAKPSETTNDRFAPIVLKNSAVEAARDR
jgi:hypothetical protein